MTSARYTLITAAALISFASSVSHAQVSGQQGCLVMPEGASSGATQGIFSQSTSDYLRFDGQCEPDTFATTGGVNRELNSIGDLIEALDNKVEDEAGNTLASANAYADDLFANAPAADLKGLSRSLSARQDEIERLARQARREARAAGAMSLALSGLRYDPEPGATSIATGLGHWKGETALAVGVGHNPSKDFRLNASGALSSQGVGVSAGASWTLR